MHAIKEPELIEKESITSLNFSNRAKVEQHPNLFSQLQDATRLGNAYRSKVAILFEDDAGLKRVDTTIWALGSKYICLKGGTWLPIDRIREIRA